MNNYSIFSDLLQSRHLRPADVCRATGISSSTLTDWKAGRSTPKAENMKKIADFLNVSVPYLMGIPQSRDEQLAEIMELAESLTVPQKDALIALIKTLQK